MKRLAVLLLLATPLFAAEKWLDNYNKGVAAVNAARYKAGADALAAAIAERPTEGTSIRAGQQIITVYTPHFFLGIAKFNLGDVDGALREWKISEEQGSITRTEYYANLKDWVARAQTEKQRNAATAAAGPKKSADAAISRALAMQVDALSAGADRTESYRAAQRKLQEAMGQFQKAGTNIEAYKTAENTAGQAVALFTNAADEAKKLKAAAAAKPPAPKPQPAVIQPRPVVQQPPPAPVKTEAEVNAEIAVQSFSRDVDAASRNTKREVQNVVREEARMAEMLRGQLANATSDADFHRIAKTAADRGAAMTRRIAELNAPKPVPAPAPVVTAQIPLPVAPAPQTRDVSADLRSAYRAYAAGDLASAEQILSRVLDGGASAEAYLLRGAARYTRAVLSRTPDALLGEARADFEAALAEKATLRLDPRAFSPKLVAFFEQVRQGR